MVYAALLIVPEFPAIKVRQKYFGNVACVIDE